MCGGEDVVGVGEGDGFGGERVQSETETNPIFLSPFPNSLLTKKITSQPDALPWLCGNQSQRSHSAPARAAL